jgi:ATP-dependent protease ClpP protease subunit
VEAVKRIWELKQAAAPDTLEMYIYGDVESDSYDWWTDEIIESETSANHFRNELAKYPNAMKINIFINSYGGSVFEGTAIYNQLRRHPAQKIVHVDGFACSVAATIAMAGDKVVMPRNAMMMIHNAWTVAMGNGAELRKAADDLDVINKGNRQAYLQKASGKITEDELVQLLDAETWLTAEDCIKYGLADEYAEQDADMDNAQKLLQKANRTLEQKLSYNKAVAAQLRQFVKEESEPKEPQAEPQEPPKQNNLKNFLAGLKTC